MLINSQYIISKVIMQLLNNLYHITGVGLNYAFQGNIFHGFKYPNHEAVRLSLLLHPD